MSSGSFCLLVPATNYCVVGWLLGRWRMAGIVFSTPVHNHRYINYSIYIFSIFLAQKLKPIFDFVNVRKINRADSTLQLFSITIAITSTTRSNLEINHFLSYLTLSEILHHATPYDHRPIIMDCAWNGSCKRNIESAIASCRTYIFVTDFVYSLKNRLNFIDLIFQIDVLLVRPHWVRPSHWPQHSYYENNDRICKQSHSGNQSDKNGNRVTVCSYAVHIIFHGKDILWYSSCKL